MSPTEGQPDRERMRKLEDAAAENLEDYVRAYGRVAPQLDAHCIRVASGVAAFTGIGSPLTTVKGAGPPLSASELDEIEAFFSDHHAATVTIEMAPWASQETGLILGERGYVLADQEGVMVRSSGEAPSGRVFRAEAIPVQAWVEIMYRTSDLPEGRRRRRWLPPPPSCRLRNSSASARTVAGSRVRSSSPTTTW
jgi:hypothetical protein